MIISLKKNKQEENHMKCRHCKSETNFFLDLGFSPPSNNYLSQEDLDRPEICYPLRLEICPTCLLVQTKDFLPPSVLFGEDYAYFSSVSNTWLKHSKDYSEMIIDKLKLKQNSLVIEIASNDGYLLKNFLEKKIPCIGIEPTHSTATASKKLGIETIEDFFGLEMAATLPKADLVIGNNVYAHVSDVNNFTKAMKAILKEEGVITLEFPHLMTLIQEVQFDSIYHEHFSYFTLRTVIRIFSLYGLRIYDVEEIKTHGGSLRIYGCHEESLKKNTAAISKILSKEKDAGLYDTSTYKNFFQSICKIRDDFLLFLLKAKKEGKRVVAYGAAAKGNTFLNFAGVKKDFIEAVYDKAESKQGKYLPGSHIPITSPDILKKEMPDYLSGLN